MVGRIAVLVLCAVGMLTAQAQAQVFLEQAKVSLDVSAGDHRDGSLLVHNMSADPINIRAYWEDFQYKPPYDGSKNFLPAGTAPASANQWVSFSPQNFLIPAYGQQKIDYTVTVPPQIEEGHYGVLFFERSVAGKLDNEAVNLVTRIGCLFFIEPTNKTKKADLRNIALKANNVTADFVNQGNVILIPRTTYYVMEEGGMVLLRGETKKLYLPPGASTRLKVPISEQFKQGHYTLVINSDLQEGDVVVKEIGLAVDASGQMTIENPQD